MAAPAHDQVGLVLIVQHARVPQNVEYGVGDAFGLREVETPAVDDDSADLRPLFEAILKHIPTPAGNPQSVLQLLVANLDYSDYLGRLAIGRVFAGILRYGDEVAISKLDGSRSKNALMLRSADALSPVRTSRAILIF